MWVIEIGDHRWGLELPEDYTGEVRLQVRRGHLSSFGHGASGLRPVSGTQDIQEVRGGNGLDGPDSGGYRSP